ncbi:hypothetical protein P167DRAFT_414418 [Morchella conica CCBAS932]|uniref:Uncharacterized protein n=1 Tax=Morchella conica CCBAS932 TaxID=1392247 RepID=A0A3N4KDK5_9PEZI|nr:hypothetical protein P167DRAFT_414418 [Morchella conica CCBAS932]
MTTITPTTTTTTTTATKPCVSKYLFFTLDTPYLLLSCSSRVGAIGLTTSLSTIQYNTYHVHFPTHPIITTAPHTHTHSHTTPPHTPAATPPISSSPSKPSIVRYDPGPKIGKGGAQH